jgi:hypothetical protein
MVIWAFEKLKKNKNNKAQQYLSMVVLNIIVVKLIQYCIKKPPNKLEGTNQKPLTLTLSYENSRL